MSGMTLVYAIFVAVVVFLEPALAHAWGPGMHVEVALGAISKIAIAAPFVRELVSKFPDAFLYGSTSPDIVVGKKYAGYFHHCHNWRMGWLILDEAKNERQKAAALGYLVHLAADIVAHNYYIPVKTVRSFRARLLSHTYWEMRFDLGVREEAWERLQKIKELEIDEFDDLLDRVLKKTLFSFSTNKKIFNTILILQKMKAMRRSLAFYARHSRFDIEDENRQHYVDLTMESVLEFLKRPRKAMCLDVDPTGVKKIEYAKKLRKNIRSKWMLGVISDEDAEGFVEFVKEQLAIGLYRPDMKLPAANKI